MCRLPHSRLVLIWTISARCLRLWNTEQRPQFRSRFLSGDYFNRRLNSRLSSCFSSRLNGHFLSHFLTLAVTFEATELAAELSRWSCPNWIDESSGRIDESRRNRARIEPFLHDLFGASRENDSEVYTNTHLIAAVCAVGRRSLC